MRTLPTWELIQTLRTAQDRSPDTDPADRLGPLLDEDPGDGSAAGWGPTDPPTVT